jgi:hypothetical protein
MVARAADFYPSRRLGISLATLQKALEKVGGPLVFAPRPGSTQGTQETRLAENVGIVQASGDPGNLIVAVLWLPVDNQGKLAGAKARAYLDTFSQIFSADREAVARWVKEVLERAVTETEKTPYLESQLFAGHQFKAIYTPTLNPPMVSLTVTAAEEE